ncbi:hypothetical protein G6F60_015024 [Rhizopus arrhizus]|nr:hypothetical protein G6F60_015024 [Rhizopus arrhizus]
MARGISTPATDKGPDRPHRMPVNATSDTIALNAPMASVREPVTNIAMSCSMRWSGLSTGASTKWPRL